MNFELLSQKQDESGNYLDGYFSWSGCDNLDCDAHGLGATVYDCQGYRTLKEAQEDREGNLYEVALCAKCIYEQEYGEGTYEG